ncbi:MAG TPA: hypothetical protein VIL69_00955 [Roseomonas sp.]|jgi:uncharacterized membrane protein
MPGSGGMARRRALWRLLAVLPLLAIGALPEAAWPAGMGHAVGLLWELLPALFSAGFAWGFARTLLPGREPLIARYIRFDETRDDEQCAGYARGLTLFWAVALGVAAVAEAASVARGIELGYAPDAVLLALFLGEHAVRSLRFPSGGIAWPSQTLRAVIRAERARHG